MEKRGIFAGIVFLLLAALTAGCGKREEASGPYGEYPEYFRQALLIREENPQWVYLLPSSRIDPIGSVDGASEQDGGPHGDVRGSEDPDVFLVDLDFGEEAAASGIRIDLGGYPSKGEWSPDGIFYDEENRMVYLIFKLFMGSGHTELGEEEPFLLLVELCQDTPETYEVTPFPCGQPDTASFPFFCASYEIDGIIYLNHARHFDCEGQWELNPRTKELYFSADEYADAEALARDFCESHADDEYVREYGAYGINQYFVCMKTDGVILRYGNVGDEANKVLEFYLAYRDGELIDAMTIDPETGAVLHTGL